MNTDTNTYNKPKESQDFLPLNGTDYVEFWVGNAKQAAHFYKTAFGFQSLAYSGPETGVRDRVSYVLVQDKVRFMLSTALTPDHEINDHYVKHGDGVRTVALMVDDATSAFEETVKRGAKPFLAPERLEDEHGVGLKYIDHMVGNVDWGQMNKWCEFYRDVMGFDQLMSFDDKDISTEFTALMSKVMSNSNMRVKFPINEPAEGKKKSQIEEYIDFYQGAGVQHVAIATDDIIDTVTELRKRGVEFLEVPESYYGESLFDRVGKIDERIEDLRKLKILVDRDEDGYLLQLFTKPLEDRPTLFFEIIQRKGAQSFGKGNFKALFEAIEREQDARGNL
ncbi:UNVERIFIED_CONTAM: hypothetical protein GTU68_029103 [Idotea baltica]|nr:hypothetical protein [Idotea baltica]